MSESLTALRELQDTCFLALQRPAMLWGVPYLGALLNFSGSVITGAWFGMIAGHPWYQFIWWAAVGTPTHIVMKMVCNRDHHLFRIGLLWLQTKAQSSLDNIYGGKSLSPLSVRAIRNFNEYPISLSFGEHPVSLSLNHG